MHGILGWGVHLPHHRLDRAQIAPVAGTGGGTGTRTVASYDEDTTTMGVAAARAALRARPAGVRSLWFATAEPAYLDKTNATAVHAALRLDRDAAAYDAVGSVRSALGALRAALTGPGTALAVAADLRAGLPGGPDEAEGGDGAAALVVGSAADGPVLAEVAAWVSLTEEFTDRWRVPGKPASRRWEERFGEVVYARLGAEALKLALAEAGVATEDVARLIVAGTHARAARTVAAGSGVPAGRVADRLHATVGNTGAAQPAMLLAAALETAAPGDHLVLLTLSDGADAIVLRATAALAEYRPAAPVAEQAAAGAPVSYGAYLAWRGLLRVEPPRRPEPARPSSSAASRNADWKYGFAGPPGAPRPMADVAGTIAAFTVDRLAYSPSPPMVFAVVDFDGGGRLPVELTDVDAAEVAVGDRVEPTFRRLFTADGIHNYFWKARPVRGGTER
ncbi:hydroxymethylglutaryl-CoA synthase [Actinomadura craniellae]|uniref:Hydroxymethylglutaryl-CoA synthase n=1 Tax=Actinomadura craniellae TaxID=2231787 RepID=A0A365HB62_9ACTN|nr:OB-fold domain-containing protein [Actinomadura craniellae]RAY16252.1 hydroxymethylglutaryl-CoA synthase [Actinomadura craniellae]